jgi:hypothetical protein
MIFLKQFISDIKIDRLRQELKEKENHINILKEKSSIDEVIIEHLEKEINRLKIMTRITLIRTYHPSGTNGSLIVNDKLICYTIELPWVDNQRRVSCIPEGEYELTPRHSARFGHHIYVNRVPGRSAILFHPANNAATELEGCIAPVTTLTGPGRGYQSRAAMDKLLSIMNGSIAEGKKVFLTIKDAASDQHIDN